MKLVTIATNFNLADADMIRSRLEAAGFHPFVANENTSAWFGRTMSTASMLLIEVPEDEVADVQEFLAAPAE